MNDSTAELYPARIKTFYAGAGEVFAHDKDSGRVHLLGGAEAALFGTLDGAKTAGEHLAFLQACEPNIPVWALAGYVKHWIELGLLRPTVPSPSP